jgi:iron complex transport system substrate-binding protein
VKNKLLLIISFVLITVGCSSKENAEAGQKENNDPENNKVVSTTVAVTEIMDALEIDLIGIPTSYKVLPERYDGITKVGNPMSPDMELIMSLQPKEVMSVTTLKYDLESVFDDAGIETSYVNLESIDDMHEEILKLGHKYGREAQAEKVVKEFDHKLIEIEEKIKENKKPRVLVLMGVPGSYLVATDKSYIGDLVTKSGGENVFSGERVEFLASNTEHLHESNPDIILRAAHGMPEEVVEMFDQEFKENDIWKHFEAVENNRVYDLEETIFGTTGNLAAAEALDELYTILYPEE